MTQPVMELEVRPKSEPVTTGNGDALATVIERIALDPAVDVEKLQRMLDMQKEIMALQAKAAFDAAFAQMQGEIPVVIERGQTNNGWYAPLEDIVAAVRPILQRHGFSLSHRTEWPDKGIVRIIGILAHKLGHEKHSEFISGADNSGNKNAIQGLGSAMSYGRRYTTNDLLCIVTRHEDDNGSKGGKSPKELPDQPDGYELWLHDLTNVAESEGLPGLQRDFAKSRVDLRNYLTGHESHRYADIRAKARKVKP